MTRVYLSGLIVTLLLAAAIAMAGARTAAAASVAYKRCHGTFGPRGEPGQGFWHAVRVKRTSCRRGKRVIRAYLRQGGGRRTVRGYRCRIRIVTTENDPEGTGHLRCVRGRKAIRATGHP